MLVERDIYESYRSQIESATEVQKKALADECFAMRTWGERWGVDMEDVSPKVATVPMVFETPDGLAIERDVERCFFDFESANRSVLRSLDERVVEAYRALKKVEFARPSSVLYGSFFMEMTAEGGLDRYLDSKDKLRGVRLVMQRLHSTCRVAFRFENQRYHRSATTNRDGSVDIVYGNERWRNELIARRVIKGRG